MPANDNISKLLRLKRYEQPPPGYFENFLREFQDRQRSELLRLSFWEIAWGRISLMLSGFQVPRLAYASIAAMAVATTTLVLLRPGADPVDMQQISLFASQPVTIGGTLPVATISTGVPAVHYVLPTSPVSYASPRSF